MRWALNGGILAARSLVVNDRLPEMRTKGRTRIQRRDCDPATVETAPRYAPRCGFPGGGRRSLLCRLAVFVIGAERAAQRAPRPLWHLWQGHFAIERRKNGAADRLAPQQAGQDGAAEPLYETRRRSITAARNRRPKAAARDQIDGSRSSRP